MDLELRFQTTTVENGVASSQVEIECEIAEPEEDSANDAREQLEQQQLAAEEDRVEEDVNEAAKDVQEGLAFVCKAAEEEAETIVKDAAAELFD